MNRIEREQTMPDVLTLAEATQFFRVSRPTLLKALKSGQIDGIKIGKVWRVLRNPSKVGLKSFLKAETIDSLQEVDG